MTHQYAVRFIALALMSVAYHPVSATEVDCLYSATSEWPWLDSRVCQLPDRPLIFNDEGTPVCSSARADKDGDGWGWENDQSCIIDPDQPETQSTVPSLVVEQEDLVVFEQDFESAVTGSYIAEALNQQWKTPMWHMGIREGRASLVDDSEKGKALQVLFPAHTYGSKGAVAFLTDLSFGSGLERNFEELYLSYDVKFSENFDFVQGGKLPGLCGYNTTLTPEDGCNTGGGIPTGYDGFSARGMWREDGIMESYMYHSNQFYEYGDDEHWSLKAEPGKWHTVQHRVVMNTVGEANGIIEAWLDGVKVLSSTNMLYRKTPDIGINLFYFSTFYGGADPSWAPSSDQYAYFDNFRIATTPLPETEASAVAPVNATSDSATQQAVTATADSSTVETNASIETIAAIETDATDTLQAASSPSSEPEIGAAKAPESGGGTFHAWFIAVLLLVRRRLLQLRYSITLPCES